MMMGRFLGLTMPHTHNHMNTIVPRTIFPSSSSSAAAASSFHFLGPAKAKAQWKIGKRPPRRLVLGVAASFLDQLGRMATGLFSSVTASARTKSNVEQVPHAFIHSPPFLFLCHRLSQLG